MDEESDVNTLLKTVWSDCNDGLPIEWLISAPTMRVPAVIQDTANAYLAFRAVLIAGKLLPFLIQLTYYDVKVTLFDTANIL